MKILDISPRISESSPLFPGDEPFALRWTATIGPGCPVNLSALSLSPHTGAHADAPLHYASGAPSIADVDLEPYWGPCRVLDVRGCGALVEPAHVRRVVAGLPPRVLLRTCESAPTQWSPDFAAIAPATVALLAELGVRLVGIDTASVDPAESKDLPCHQMLLRTNMRVLENLMLDGVAEGDYELVALPLRIAGACASPVRAALRTLR